MSHEIPKNGYAVTLIANEDGWTWQTWKDGETTGSFSMDIIAGGARGAQQGCKEDVLCPEELGMCIDEECDDSGLIEVCKLLKFLGETEELSTEYCDERFRNEFLNLGELDFCADIISDTEKPIYPYEALTDNKPSKWVVMSDEGLVDVYPDEDDRVHIPLMTFKYVSGHETSMEEIMGNLSSMVLQKIFNLIPEDQINQLQTEIPVRAVRSVCDAETRTTTVQVGFMTVVPK